ncbi:MAG: beta-lactamase family protein [Spirochaetales bacterium]|nr:beta-lactamase family protein [Spirochaetales bacterium]
MKPIVLKRFFLFIFTFGLLVFPCRLSFARGGLESPSTWSEVDSFINGKINDNKIAGAVVMVAGVDESLYFSASGYRDVGENLEMKDNSIFRIYSMTKPVTTVAAMMLAERGEIKLDDPVLKYIPELIELKVLSGNEKVDLKRSITVRDLMRHTAGFTYGYFSSTAVDILYKQRHPLHVTSNDQFIKRTSSLPLLYQPGEKYHYSIATDVLGVLIERVSGESLGDFFNKNIFSPLEMTDTGFFVPTAKVDRFCSSYSHSLIIEEHYRNSSYIGENPNRRESGGSGLVSTASDYMRFAQMLLNHGRYNGRRLLEESSVRQMFKNQLREGDLLYPGTGFGLGGSVQIEEMGRYGHAGDYGWSGAASTHFYISPKEKMAVIILSQILPFSNELISGLKPVIYDITAGM